MQPQNPNYKKNVAEIFEKASFLKYLGVALIDCGPGWCEVGLAVTENHLQQTGILHAGVLTTLCDHAAGGAATTLLAPSEIVLTVEFKVNFLRPASGSSVRCKATVLKPSSTLIVAESEIFSPLEKLTTKATVSMIVLNPSH